jgi:NAD(P)-dependent dehydrogenase (short-subunit alcohol dehydrogenase family)|tara:strand:+ start:268 stop:1038 length:771 start_codon:yes stop_codon:yes gene_type:complete
MNYYKNIFSVKNKTVFIIGGSGLIGKETSNCLLEHGAKIVNLDIRKNNKLKNNVFFDCSDSKNLKDNYLSIIKKFGTPKILINCSYPKTSDWNKNTFSELNEESFHKNLKSHLNSYILLSRITANIMKVKKIKGSIVLLGSIYGVLGQDLSIYKKTNIKENIAYSVIKGGIVNFTKQMASYYGNYQIRVNCICPGGVLDKVNKKNKNFIKNYTSKVPLKRLASNKEIATTILFLSSEASSYVTGTTLMVDGGWSAI